MYYKLLILSSPQLASPLNVSLSVCCSCCCLQFQHEVSPSDWKLSWSHKHSGWRTISVGNRFHHRETPHWDLSSALTDLWGLTGNIRCLRQISDHWHYNVLLCSHIDLNPGLVVSWNLIINYHLLWLWSFHQKALVSVFQQLLNNWQFVLYVCKYNINTIKVVLLWNSGAWRVLVHCLHSERIVSWNISYFTNLNQGEYSAPWTATLNMWPVFHWNGIHSHPYHNSDPKH